MTRLTFLGTGTSQGVPIIGCQCAVCKSADSRDKRFRSSALVEMDGLTILVDAGPDFRSQMLAHDVRHLDAILGNDSKLIADIAEAAKDLRPRFICLIPSQIAHMIATDCRAICRILEKKTGIPAFTLPTNSMHYYERGIFFALQKLAEITCQALPESAAPTHLPEAKWLSEEELHKLRQGKGRALRVNLLGATPLEPVQRGENPCTWLGANAIYQLEGENRDVGG